jgi:ankyrin repeat protein
MSYKDFLRLCARPDQKGALALLDQHSDWLGKGLEGEVIVIHDKYLWPGSTAIIAAAAGGSVGLIEALLKRGADVRKVDDDGENALMTATRYGHVGAATLLLDRAPDLVESRNKSRMTPLNRAADYRYDRDHFDIVQLLVNRGAQIDAVNNNGNTPVHVAAIKNNFQVVRFLVNRGAQIDAVDDDGKNALHMASELGSLDMCLSLISRGLDPRIADNEDQTALTLFGSAHDDNDPDDDEDEVSPQLLMCIKQ